VSNDPTDSVKALKEVVVLRIGFNPTRSTSPRYNPTHAWNIQWYTKYTKLNLSTVKWAQWDKTQSRELLGLIRVCTALCTIVVDNIAQKRSDNFPSYPPDNCSHDVRYLREGGLNKKTHKMLKVNKGTKTKPKQNRTLYSPVSTPVTLRTVLKHWRKCTPSNHNIVSVK